MLYSSEDAGMLTIQLFGLPRGVLQLFDKPGFHAFQMLQMPMWSHCHVSSLCLAN